MGEDAWPPEQPKGFTPVVLIHYEEQCNIRDATAITQVFHTRGISDVISATPDQPVLTFSRLCNHKPLREALQTSKVTRNIFIVSLEQCDSPQMVIIEGAPGIGKSMLMKHIAYSWAEGEILLKFHLVLLVCLRDPSMLRVSSISITELPHSFCKFNMNTSSLAACNKTLFQNKVNPLFPS